MGLTPEKIIKRSFSVLGSTSTILILSLLVQILTGPAGASNILVFLGSGTYSHKTSVWPLVLGLADRGHNVTVLSGYEKSPKVHPKVHDLQSTAIVKTQKNIYVVDRVTDRLNNAQSKIFDSYNEDIVRTCESIMYAKDDPILDYIIRGGDKSKFDLIINNLVLGDCGLIIAHQMNTKMITFASAPFISWFFDEFGFPDEPSVIPDMSDMSWDARYPMGFWKRLWNYWRPLQMYLERRFYVYPKLEAIMKDVYNLTHVEPFEQIYSERTSLVLGANHYSSDFARSVPPFWIPIGGMQCWMPTQPLSGEFKEVLDKAKDGAVLIAFGSTINLATLPKEIKNSFLNMMNHFPQITFIWRWDGSPPENVPKNLILSKWLPQFQILGHPNLKAFISHAGLNSISEATYHGVPVMLIPLFADQDYNGYRIQATEIGLRLEVKDIDSQLLINSMEKILHDPKYTRNMKVMSSLFRDRPMNPIETAVYWTEFVLRHDDTSALKPLKTVNFFQRRQLDVALVILFFLTLSTSLTLVLLGWLIRAVFRINGEGPEGINTNDTTSSKSFKKSRKNKKKDA